MTRAPSNGNAIVRGSSLARNLFAREILPSQRILPAVRRSSWPALSLRYDVAGGDFFVGGRGKKRRAEFVAESRDSGRADNVSRVSSSTSINCRSRDSGQEQSSCKLRARETERAICRPKSPPRYVSELIAGEGQIARSANSSEINTQ